MSANLLSFHSREAALKAALWPVPFHSAKTGGGRGIAYYERLITRDQHVASPCVS